MGSLLRGWYHRGQGILHRPNDNMEVDLSPKGKDASQFTREAPNGWDRRFDFNLVLALSQFVRGL